MSYKEKGRVKFSPRQRRFLELFFGGFTMSAAARAAGYRGSSASSLCNTARAILLRAAATDARIIQLLLDMTVHNQYKSGRLKGLSILSKALFSRR